MDERAPREMTAGDAPRPRRAMGLRDLVLFYIVTGISLRWIATAATAGPSAIVVWIVAWLAFFIPLAFAVVELSSRHPEEGGLYVWSKKAFGDFAGFMTGWTYWASNLPYFPSVLYFTASNALFLGGGRWDHLADDRRYFILFAVVGLGFGTVVNVVGLGVGKWLHNAGGVGTWIPVLILFGLGIAAYVKYGSATTFTASEMMPKLHVKDMIFWSTLFFAFGGSESASFLGDEIRDVRRNLPRALFIAGIVTTTAYILGTVAVLVALPAHEVSGLGGIMQAISKSSERLGFGILIPIAALLITVSNIGAVGAWLAATARLPFVAGLDRFLPPAFAKVHPRWKTPHVALLVEAALGMLFIFLGQAGTTVKGAYDVLVSMGIIAYFIPYLLTFAALIRLQDEAAEPGVFRIPGGKPVAIALGSLGLLTTTLTICISVIPAEDEANKPLAVLKIVGLTLVLLLVGAGIYASGKRRIRRDAIRRDARTA